MCSSANDDASALRGRAMTLPREAPGRVPLRVDAPPGNEGPGPVPARRGALLPVDFFLGTDPRRRRRTSAWVMSLFLYSGSALVMAFGVFQGWLDGGHLLAWSVSVAVAETAIYLALRSGWSERLADPAMTTVQMVAGIVAVLWGYLFCGPVRSVTLYPLLLIFVFGAFALSWRRIAWLTGFALAGLAACVLALNTTRAGPAPWSLDNPEFRSDVVGLLAVVIVLPALSMVAARLSGLRRKLVTQRGELSLALAEVQRLASHDELTGLPNRREMQQRLEQEHARFQRTGEAFSVAVLDLDHFKQINDAQGHAGGDEVLRVFAAAVRDNLRGMDVFARWGGEEFLLLLPGTAGQRAQGVVQRLLEHVHAIDIGFAPNPGATGRRLSFSAGVAEQRRDEPVADTVARADRHMYEAKRAGRDTVRLG